MTYKKMGVLAAMTLEVDLLVTALSIGEMLHRLFDQSRLRVKVKSWNVSNTARIGTEREKAVIVRVRRRNDI